MYTAHNANGTGAYMLKSREPDIKTVLVKNPNWWGIKEGKFEGNVDEVVYMPIGSDATRLAALDVGRDRPHQRPAAAGRAAPEAEHEHQGARGHREPHHLHRHGPAARRAAVLQRQGQEPVQGQARAAGAVSGDRHRGDADDDHARTVETHRARCCRRRCRGRRSRSGGLPFDRAKAKQLLAEAGYPNGFEVTLDCPNNRYVNDEKICQALAAMWSADRRRDQLVTMPRANYFPKLEKLDTSLYMLGWGGAATDAIFILQPVLHDGQRQGRRRLQLRPLHQSQARRAGREGQGGHEPGEAPQEIREALTDRSTTRSIICRCTARSSRGRRAATSPRCTAPTTR